MYIFIKYDAPVTASLFAVLMLAGWLFGARVARRSQGVHALTRFDDAALALFGLLMAFCFSGAASRYDLCQRLVLDEATAIGDFSGTSSVLAEPEHSQLAREIRAYVGLRLVFGRTRMDDPQMPALMARTRGAQDRLGTLATHAVQSLNTPTLHMPLINNLNAVTTAYDNRLQGLRDKLPESIVFILMAFGVFSTFTMGRVADGARRGSAFAYVALVATVFWIILDLEMPSRGWLRASQQPMEELAAHLP
jgi:hypothetical protein